MEKDAIEQSSILFRFGALEARLAEMHEIHNEKRSNFQARLKNLHRLGFPAGVSGKAGKATLYDEAQTVQMALAVELAQAGLEPSRMIEVYTRNSFPIHMALLIASRQLLEHPKGFDPRAADPDNDPISMFLYFDPAALGDLTFRYGRDESDEDPASVTFFYGGSGVVAENLVRWTTGTIRRLFLLNVTTMLWDLAESFGETGRAIFYTAVNEWAEGQISGDDFDLESWVNTTVRREFLDQGAGKGPDQWGEIGLPQLLERSGFAQYAGHYYETPDDSAGDVPDLILHLPGQRSIAVDAKLTGSTSLQARVERLSGRPYRTPFTDGADFQVLYVPSRAQLEAALRHDAGLVERAFRDRIILASPDNFISIIHAMEAAWDDELRSERVDAAPEPSGGKALSDLTEAEVEDAIVEATAAGGLPRFVMRAALDATRPEREKVKAQRRQAAPRKAEKGADNGDS